MSQHITIFDLDKTVIDSDHRTPYNGQDLDLAAYRKAQTHDNIMKDRLLPLATYMQDMIANGDAVVIVTARRMTKSDYIFLRKNGLKAVHICSRDQLFKRFDNATAKMIYNLGDSAYKWHWFNYLQQRSPMAQFTVYDDHTGVLQVAKSFGFRAYNAIDANDMLAHFLDVGFSMGYDKALEDLEINALNTVHQILDFEEDQAVMMSA